MRQTLKLYAAWLLFTISIGSIAVSPLAHLSVWGHLVNWLAVAVGLSVWWWVVKPEVGG